MRKISANYVFSHDKGFLRFGIIEIDDKACIQNIIDTKGNMKEIQGLEFYSGLLVAGRITKEELLKLKEQRDVDLSVLLVKVLAAKSYEGLTVFHDVDLVNFFIKSTTSVEILA